MVLFGFKNAAVKSMEWGNQMGFTRVQVEGDALNVIRSINHEDVDMSALGNIIQEAKTAKRSFLECTLIHTKREGNKAAHEIAKHAAFSNSEIDYTQFIMPLLANDCYPYSE